MTLADFESRAQRRPPAARPLRLFFRHPLHHQIVVATRAHAHVRTRAPWNELQMQWQMIDVFTMQLHSLENDLLALDGIGFNCLRFDQFV